MTNITTLRPGEHFMFKNFEWVCLDPNLPMRKATGITIAPVMCGGFYLIWRTLFSMEKVCWHIP